jgi:hypothetical protein
VVPSNRRTINVVKPLSANIIVASTYVVVVVVVVVLAILDLSNAVA